MRSTPAAALALLALIPLTACGTGDDSTATAPLTSSMTPSTPTVADSPSSSPASDPNAIATSYPDIGLVFDDLPQATGVERAAVKTWTDFEVSSARTLTTLAPDPAASRVMAADLVKGLSNNVAWLKAHHQRYAGTMRDRFVRVAGSSRNIVVLDICYDGSGAWLAPTDGIGKREPLHGAQTSMARVQVSNVAQRWKVTALTVQDQPC